MENKSFFDFVDSENRLNVGAYYSYLGDEKIPEWLKNAPDEIEKGQRYCGNGDLSHGLDLKGFVADEIEPPTSTSELFEWASNSIAEINSFLENAEFEYKDICELLQDAWRADTCDGFWHSANEILRADTMRYTATYLLWRLEIDNVKPKKWKKFEKEFLRDEQGLEWDLCSWECAIKEFFKIPK